MDMSSGAARADGIHPEPSYLRACVAASYPSSMEMEVDVADSPCGGITCQISAAAILIHACVRLAVAVAAQGTGTAIIAFNSRFSAVVILGTT